MTKSSDDEPSFFEKNKTLIIVGGSVFAVLLVATVISVVVAKSRKGRSVSPDLYGSGFPGLDKDVFVDKTKWPDSVVVYP